MTKIKSKEDSEGHSKGYPIDRSHFFDQVEAFYKESEQELDSLISYVIAGALGFVISFNNLMFNIREANHKVFLLFGVLILVFTFLFILVKKIITIEVLKQLREMANSPENIAGCSDTEIVTYYQKWFVILEWIRWTSYLLFIAGMICEGIFYFLNISING